MKLFQMKHSPKETFSRPYISSEITTNDQVFIFKNSKKNIFQEDDQIYNGKEHFYKVTPSSLHIVSSSKY
jgi:hypothetical protein